MVKVDHDIVALASSKSSRKMSKPVDSSIDLNVSHHSSSTNKLLSIHRQNSKDSSNDKRLINDENRRIGDLIEAGGRSVSQVRLGARRFDLNEH